MIATPHALAQAEQAAGLACRICGGTAFEEVVDLGWSPLANAYCTRQDLAGPLTLYPLAAVICDGCRLMQLTASPPPETHFTDYRYFSSFSSTMVEHARRYAQDVIARFGFTDKTHVVEIASNDGYLLQHFKGAGIPVLGIEPAANIAEAARKRHGIRTVERYFGLALARELAAQGEKADLLIANNVMAHVPDPNDFIAGMALLLAPEGVVTVEFPDVANLLALGQFDTIYHEHISYFSLPVVQQLFKRHGLRLFDAEAVDTHGGSLRIYACNAGARHSPHLRLETLMDAAPRASAPYRELAAKARRIKLELLSFLLEARKKGKQTAGYGAAAKATTLFNYCGIKPDLLAYVADTSPHKQGLYLPGAAIPIVAPEALARTKPDYVLILPWNLRQEIMTEHRYIKDWGGKFVTAIPALEIHPS